MKKLAIILLVMILALSCVFAGESHKGLSIGANISYLYQGVSARYDFGRWFEVEGVVKLPLIMGVVEVVDKMSNGNDFDPYLFLGAEVAVTGYVTPIQAGCFSLALGARGYAMNYTNGPWVSNPGKDNEEQKGAGTAYIIGLSPAVKLQFDFETWGFSIGGSYPVLATAGDVGDINIGTGLILAFGQIYNSVAVGFDFKI